MAGSTRQPGKGSWQLRVHAGRDPLNGLKRYIERTFRGTKREASKALAALIVEAERLTPEAAKKGTVEDLLREWLEHASSSFSPRTVSTSRQYMETAIIPGIGAIPVRQAYARRPRSLLSPASQTRCRPRPVRPGDDPARARDRPTCPDPRGPLGMDLPQPRCRRLAAQGPGQGAVTSDARTARAPVSPRRGAASGVGSIHPLGCIEWGPSRRAHRTALERRRSRSSGLDH